MIFVLKTQHMYWLSLVSAENNVCEPGPGARFSRAPETFRARKAIFRSSVSKNGEVYTPETSCMKETSLSL